MSETIGHHSPWRMTPLRTNQAALLECQEVGSRRRRSPVGAAAEQRPALRCCAALSLLRLTRSGLKHAQ